MIAEFFQKLFNTSDYPARWTCGNWSKEEGWLHILSDMGIWSAYLAIPLVLLSFMRQRKDLPFRRIFLLFGAFILLCGTTHLMDAAVFWWPAYRLAGLIKLVTAVVSWATVMSLFSVMPAALRMRSPEELEREIAARRLAEEVLLRTNFELEQRVLDRTAELTGTVAELQTSEFRYRRLFEASHVGVLVLDPDSQKIIDASPFMARLLGYEHDQLVGREMFQIGLFKDEQASREVFLKLKTEGRLRFDDLALESLDGKKHEVEIVANFYNEAGRSVIQCNVLDISERKEAQITSNRLAAIIASSADAIISMDLNGIITSWNQGAEQIYGYTAAEMVGFSITRLIPSDRQDEEAQILAKIHLGENSHHCETLRQTKDGRLIDVSITASPIKDATGRVIGVSKVARDITERKQAANMLSKAKEAAEAANYSKDRFLAVLSHELRTPLTPVLMTVAVLEHDPALRQDVREEMTMIRRNIEMETKLIDDLLDVSRIASGKLQLRIEPLDLNAAVLHVCSICRPQLLGQEVELTLDLCEDVGFIAADPARFEQVLWNVVKNAAKFTPRRGRIHVTSRRLSQTRVEVRISDNGVGIAPEVLPRIFDAFEQGDTRITRQFGGLGLGLAISKALIELHGGTIRAESLGSGLGATFVIDIPGTPLERTAAARTAASELARTPVLRLLVVEDHGDTARALQTLLSQAGFSVTIARDVASALAAARRETFDILVSDLGLPDASGYELMSKVREIQAIPGIAMSGYAMEEDVRLSLEAGFSEHLIKPIKIPQLIAAIGRVNADGINGSSSSPQVE